MAHSAASTTDAAAGAAPSLPLPAELASGAYLIAGPRTDQAPLAGVECLRILACVGIAAFHMQAPGREIAYAGLPAFAVLTVAFAAISAGRSGSVRAFVRKRARRLLAPWLFWSLFYGVVRVVMAARDGEAPLGWVDPWMLAMGTAIHLWYLPFALGAGVLAALWAAGGERARGDHPGGRFAGWTLASAGAIMGAAWLLRRGEAPAPLEQWIFALPAVPVGIALAAVRAGGGGGGIRLAILAGAVGAACAPSVHAGDESFAVPYAVGVLACAVAWGMPRRRVRGLRACSELSFGVYLLHPFFMLVLWKFAPGYGNAWPGVAVVVAASAAATWAIQRTPLRVVV